MKKKSKLRKMTMIAILLLLIFIRLILVCLNNSILFHILLIFYVFGWVCVYGIDRWDIAHRHVSGSINRIFNIQQITDIYTLYSIGLSSFKYSILICIACDQVPPFQIISDGVCVCVSLLLFKFLWKYLFFYSFFHFFNVP